jgi:hypothetical protein
MNNIQLFSHAVDFAGQTPVNAYAKTITGVSMFRDIGFCNWLNNEFHYCTVIRYS